jgi:hypothetical protein
MQFPEGVHGRWEVDGLSRHSFWWSPRGQPCCEYPSSIEAESTRSTGASDIYSIPTFQAFQLIQLVR